MCFVLFRVPARPMVSAASACLAVRALWVRGSAKSAPLFAEETGGDERIR